MAKGPFDDDDEPTPAGSMEIGDVRVFHAKDKHGAIIKTFTLTRTARPYVYDMCDAYNAARSAAVIERGGQWYVTPSGELKLGDSPRWTAQRTGELERKAEAERQRWITAQAKR